MPESYDDQLARVRLMADPQRGEKWDLSENDRAALVAVLERLTDLRDCIEAALEVGAAEGVDRYSGTDEPQEWARVLREGLQPISQRVMEARGEAD